VQYLAPLLRIADSLDRGHAQKVKSIASEMRDGALTLLVEAADDADLEIWAANEAAQAFRDTFAAPISIQRAKTGR
jgi:exopolyphosphatase/guanosine-5'-triphosphate,3'-diphosphate pyrophosphatase